MTTVVVLPLLLAAVYFANPRGVRSLDPQQRITGYGIYRVPASSMQPTLHPGQIVFTRVGRAATRNLQRGDIVTFLVPEEDGQLWLKRIVGLPGETLAIEGGRVFVDGRRLEEAYVDAGNVRSPYSRTMAPVRIPADRYFVLGDNRDRSHDSRLLELTRGDDITGKLVTRP